MGEQVAYVTCDQAGDGAPLPGQFIGSGLLTYQIVKSEFLSVAIWPPSPPMYRCEVIHK
jgi:hypothetical protein